VLAFVVAMAVCDSAVAQTGTWTQVANSAPGYIQTMLLLPDGTVMAQDANTYNNWYRLAPGAKGGYTNGTWTTLASMNDTRLYDSSQVLTNGRAFIAGGEYGTGTDSAEIYDPLLNLWTFCPGAGERFVDSISETLPNDSVLVAPVSPKTSGETVVFNASSNSWMNAAKLFRGSRQDEASWVKLPDGSILTIDPSGTNSERYIPSLNQWVNDANVPVSLYDIYGGELGPAFLLANGNAIFFGSQPHTAIYTPSGSTSPGTWVRGPDYPNNQGMPDAPGAMMVNGRILLATSPTPVSTNHFPSPMSYYEYDPVANSFALAPGPPGMNTNSSTYTSRMLDLPDGTVLYTHFGTILYVYQPAGAPLASGQPTITAVTTNFYGSYHLAGTLLNGISEGAAYGDDAQMDSNYPLVRLTDGSGNVYYARTYGWSSTGVMTGSTNESTEFMVPTNLPSGSYSLSVVANGNSSATVPFVWAVDSLQIRPLKGLAISGPTNGPFSPSSMVCTLTNIGASPLNWAATSTANWLGFSANSGALSPAGASSTVTISLTTNATNLAAGTYSATVTFSNLTSGAVQSMPFELQANPLVVNGGFETGSYAFWTFSGTSADISVSDSSYIHSGLYGAGVGDITNDVIRDLSQTIPTVPGRGYLVSCWLENTGVSNTNLFLVSWNGTNLFAQTNMPTFGYSNMQFVAAATAASTALEFGFLKDTNFFGLDDVSVGTAPPVTITTQPTNQYVAAGGTATFSVAAAGPGTLSYYWLRNQNPIAGANAATYSTNNVQLQDSGTEFSCLVSNSVEGVASSNAVLTVYSPPVFQTATRSGSSITLTWTTVAGMTNQLQYTTNLSQPVWIDLGNPILATGGSTNASVLISSNAQRFYRIALTPP
jgi:hypothetical protein